MVLRTISFSIGFCLCRTERIKFSNDTLTLEVHAVQRKLRELGERSDGIGDCAAELVVAEAEDLKVRRERREQPQRLGQRRSCASDSHLRQIVFT